MALLDNLVAWYDFDEASGNRADSHTNDLDLTDNNTVGSTTGVVGDAARFVRANNEFLSHADDALFDGTGDFAIATRVQFPSSLPTAGQMDIVTKYNQSTFTPEYRLYCDFDFNQRALVFAVGSGTAIFLSPQFTAADTWYDIITWFDSVAGVIHLQIEAGSDNTQSGISIPSDHDGAFRVGCRFSGNNHLQADVDYVAFWQRVLTADERTTLFGHVSYADIAGGGGTTLTVADASHAHAADNVALTQHNVLALQDAAHAHTADAVVLTQHHVLAVADSNHSHSAEAVTLTVALVVADATHGHTADSVTLTQHHVLAVADATHAHTADNVTLEVAGQLAVADSQHAHAADNVTLTQHHALSVQDASHGHTADNVSLGAAVQLAVQNATHAHTADGVSLVVMLLVAAAQHGHTADGVTLTQHHVLTVQDASHAHSAGNVAFSLAPWVVVMDIEMRFTATADMAMRFVATADVEG